MIKKCPNLLNEVKKECQFYELLTKCWKIPWNVWGKTVDICKVSKQRWGSYLSVTTAWQSSVDLWSFPSRSSRSFRTCRPSRPSPLSLIFRYNDDPVNHFWICSSIPILFPTWAPHDALLQPFETTTLPGY